MTATALRVVVWEDALRNAAVAFAVTEAGIVGHQGYSRTRSNDERRPGSNTQRETERKTEKVGRVEVSRTQTRDNFVYLDDPWYSQGAARAIELSGYLEEAWCRFVRAGNEGSCQTKLGATFTSDVPSACDLARCPCPVGKFAMMRAGSRRGGCPFVSCHNLPRRQSSAL